MLSQHLFRLLNLLLSLELEFLQGLFCLFELIELEYKDVLVLLGFLNYFCLPLLQTTNFLLQLLRQLIIVLLASLGGWLRRLDDLFGLFNGLDDGTPFILFLTGESLSFDFLLTVVGTFAGVFVVEEAFYGNYPAPLIIAVASTKVVQVLLSANPEAGRNHVLILAHNALVTLDLPQVNILSELLVGVVGEHENIVHSEGHPTLPPLLQELGTAEDHALTDQMIPELRFNKFRIHQNDNKV
jgi:hypothetical protein